jgi:hypothetical protein
VRAAYLSRILRVYAHRRSGPLSFWYEQPEPNEPALAGDPGYFMRFAHKAGYRGPFDEQGVPILDYGGDIGRQYNPIVVAQYGLARFNKWLADGARPHHMAWTAAARWLVRELRPNRHGVPVWMHHFDWPYRQRLIAPWYSGLAQGAGVSMLVRAARITGEKVYARAAHAAFEPLRLGVTAGGVLVTDASGDLWIEEYIVDPPTHVLNGFIWASWGVLDYARWSRRPEAWQIWDAAISTLKRRLDDFDTGWWSLYEARDRKLEMLASRYYHALHIVQLRVLHRLTGIAHFAGVADRFQLYLDRRAYRMLAFGRKAVFKLRHY